MRNINKIKTLKGMYYLMTSFKKYNDLFVYALIDFEIYVRNEVGFFPFQPDKKK